MIFLNTVPLIMEFTSRAKRGKNTSSTSEREWEWDGSIMNTYCITIDGETNPYCKVNSMIRGTMLKINYN
jgi:methyl coenzyme M reductase subunit C